MKTLLKAIAGWRLRGSTLLFMIMTANACSKQNAFLNVKSSNSAVVPTTLSDFQATLDYTNIMNSSYPMLGLLGCDNYYLTSSVYNSLQPPQNTAYIWASDIWEGQPSSDWNCAYQTVEYSNIALDGISELSGNSDSTSEYNNVKGSALFYRAFAFYNLASLFCKPYAASTASSDLGIPIPLTSNVNAKIVRATVQQTYTQIINDLSEASDLLPNTALYVTRPSVTTTYALLAKVYLAMGDFSNAGIYANRSISLNGALIDFNSSLVNISSFLPFPSNPSANPEILFYAEGNGYGTIWPFGSGIVDSNLYQSYSSNDLRLAAFYKNFGSGPFFVGTYDCYGDYNFSGIANNEIYLIRAECYARQSDTKDALADINLLLSKRYISNTFTPYATANADSILSIILTERRKELPFTANVRWEDLRRLGNSAYAITIQRNLNGAIYTLPPNDPRYVYPIPDNEIQLTGIQQNPR